MNKLNCYRIKAFLEDVFKEKNIKIVIIVIDKYAKNKLFWRMRITIDKNYNHLLEHIYSTAYSMCALDGEYLCKKKIRYTKIGDMLYLS